MSIKEMVKLPNEEFKKEFQNKWQQEPNEIFKYLVDNYDFYMSRSYKMEIFLLKWFTMPWWLRLWKGRKGYMKLYFELEKEMSDFLKK